MFSIIFLHSNGRLGNQIIELLAVKSIYQPSCTLAINFDQAASFFDDIPDILWIGSNSFYGIFNRSLAKVFWFLRLLPISVLNVFFDILEESQANITTVHKAKLSLPLIKFVWIDGPYFQNSRYLNLDLLSNFKPKYKWINSAHHILTKDVQPLEPKRYFNVFIHIRLGDYLLHDLNPDHSTSHKYVLPMHYYFNALKFIQGSSELPIRLFIASDEIDYAQKLFKDIPNSLFVDECPETTLATLSLCDAGILSASSFSWCAAFLSGNNEGICGPHLAPRFWLGFSENKWHPVNFHFSRLTYLDTTLPK